VQLFFSLDRLAELSRNGLRFLQRRIEDVGLVPESLLDSEL
jgi:hypothetical protein